MARRYDFPSTSRTGSTAPYRAPSSRSNTVTFDQLDDDEFEYATHKYRGRVYIINNFIFNVDGLPTRDFSGLDVDSLMSALKSVHFKDEHIELRENLTSDEMRELAVIASGQSYLHQSCLFFIVLTHGDDEGLYGVDGTRISYEYLLEPIRAASRGLGRLKGIPKLLLVQACNSEQAQIEHPYDLHVPQPPRPPGRLQHDAAVSGHAAPPDTAPKSDVIVAYSTLPGTEGGSRFIQAFAQVMKRDGKRLDVATMFARASRLITTVPNSTSLNKSLPSPNVSSQLMRNVYFS